MAHRLRMAAMLGMLLLAGGCHTAHHDGAVTTYTTRAIFFWVIGAGALLATVLGWALVRDDPGATEGYLYVLMPLVALLAMWTGLRNTWTVGPDGFTPPRSQAQRISRFRYDQIEQVDVVTQASVKGVLHFWDIHVKGAGVERLGRPDDPIRDHIERNLRRHRIPFTEVREPAGYDSIKFVASVLGACAVYFTAAGLLAAWARRRLKTRAGLVPRSYSGGEEGV